MEEQLPQLTATLRVVPDSHHLFTTLLQSGVEVKSSQNEEMGDFLCNLPGFSLGYITSTVETIFLNGTPVDDLSQPFEGESPTLALSAAMPGLAGAIFRKNSIHSALRTRTNTAGKHSSGDTKITVTLKLFNSIAKGAGTKLLESGVFIQAAKVKDFFTRRLGLSEYITEITLNGDSVSYDQFLEQVATTSMLDLKVINAHG